MMKKPNSTTNAAATMNNNIYSKTPAAIDMADTTTTTTKAKYPNQNLTRSRSILLHENAKSPPCITVGLRPQLEVFESSNPLEFKVIYLGEPLPLISWRKDNVPLSETMIKSKLNCSTLYLASVNAESDAGLYSCTVENSEGKVETRCKLSIVSKSVAVAGASATNTTMIKTGANSDSLGSSCTMKPSPPIIIDHLKCVRAFDGGEIELCCKIVCPPSSFDVVWIHNGKEIKPSKDFQYHHVDSRYTLKIPELFPEDSGVYTCEAFNDYGETFTTCSLYVTCPGKQTSNITDPPVTAFKTFPKSISVARGGPVVVQAELHPGCDRQVNWIKDGSVIDQSTVNDQNKVQFSIVEAGVRDTGIYELHATPIKNEMTADGATAAAAAATSNDGNEVRKELTSVAAFAIIVL